MAKDIFNEEIKVGDKVLWCDSSINDYKDNDKRKQQSRIYTIDKINGDDEDSIILISDKYGEVEVYAEELKKLI